MNVLFRTLLFSVVLLGMVLLVYAAPIVTITPANTVSYGQTVSISVTSLATTANYVKLGFGTHAIDYGISILNYTTGILPAGSYTVNGIDVGTTFSRTASTGGTTLNTLTINKAAPIIILSTPSNMIYTGVGANITATIITYNQQIPVNVWINNVNVGHTYNTISINTISSTGTYTIVANTVGNSNYTTGGMTNKFGIVNISSELAAGTGLSTSSSSGVSTFSLLPLTAGTGITIFNTNTITNNGVISLYGSAGFSVTSSTGAITGYAPSYIGIMPISISATNAISLNFNSMTLGLDTNNYLTIPTPELSISLGSNSIVYGSSTTATATCIPDADTCAVQQPLGTNLCTGIGSCTYTVPNTLAVGTYSYCANDITRNLNTCQRLVVNANIIVPSNIIYYIPTTVQNTQNTAFTANTQIPISFVASNSGWNSYLAANMMNVEWFYANGTIIPSWLEGNVLNEQVNAGLSSNTVLYWLLINNAQDFLCAYCSNTIYLGIASTSDNLFNEITGEAPQLSPIYGQYDNGRTIFPTLYDNFIGTTLNSTLWTAWSDCGGTTTIDNGMINNGCSSNFGGIFSVSSYSEDYYVLDVLGYATSLSGSAPTWGWGLTGKTSGLGLGSAVANYYSVCNIGGSNPCASLSVGSNSNYQVLSAWSIGYGTTIYGTYNYGSTNDISTTLGSSSEQLGTSLANSGYSMYTQWYRLRTLPPNSINPVVTFGSLA